MEDKLIFYSYNEENYDYSDAEECVEMFIDNANEDFKVGDIITIYEGEADKTKAGDWVSAVGLVDKMTDGHYEDCGEGDWHYKIKKEHIANLQEILEQAINIWADKYDIHPSYHKVKNVKKLEFKITQVGGKNLDEYKFEEITKGN